MENSKDRIASIINSILGLSREKKRDFIKYLLNEEYKVENSKADWDEQDRNSLKYIDNKPFGDEKRRGTVTNIPQQEINYKSYVGVRLNFKEMTWGYTYTLFKYFDKQRNGRAVYENDITPIKFIIDENDQIEYLDHTYYKIKIFNKGYNFYQNATIRAFDKNYNIYMQKYNGNNIIWDTDFLCVSGNIKRVGFDFYSSYESDGTPSVGAERINIPCHTYNYVLDIEYWGTLYDFGKLYISAYIEVTELVQVPDKYVENLIEKIENLEKKIDKLESENLYKEPLTFEILQGGGYIAWKTQTDDVIRTIEYSKNDGEWTPITSDYNSKIYVVAGDIVKFRGDNINYNDGDRGCFFETTYEFNIKGNIMSLIDSKNFATLNSLEEYSNFQGLFKNCTKLIDASKLILPATTLAEQCYAGMFEGCTNLVYAPELPAINLEYYCYAGMFMNCDNLVVSPKLPALTLAESCYTYMFKGCKNLTLIECLATDISASECVLSWVQGVKSNGKFIKDSQTSWEIGESGIPTNWEVQELEGE